MEAYRTQIDALDRQIIALLGQRFAVTKQVGEYKQIHHLPILDADRETALQERLRTLAIDAHLDPELCLVLYEIILRHSRTQQALPKHI
ncbi:MAG TPA: chorismate mutase [Candidatus Saccharimonadia bacterium]|nr:chorismate mutase [Candidatus Saccharimonadia bacterium]